MHLFVFPQTGSKKLFNGFAKIKRAYGFKSEPYLIAM